MRGGTPRLAQRLAPGAREPVSSLSPRDLRRHRTAFLFLLPTLLFYFTFMVYSFFGILNGFLRAVGLDAFAGAGWAIRKMALPSLIMVEVWASFGFNATVLLAALQNIDQNVLDAAKIDGAKVWQRFVNVLIPQLGHVITLLVSLALIGGFKVFDLLYIVEKPMALSLAEADAMIAACERAGVRLGVVLQRRFDPIYERVRAAIA